MLILETACTLYKSSSQCHGTVKNFQRGKTQNCPLIYIKYHFEGETTTYFDYRSLNDIQEHTLCHHSICHSIQTILYQPQIAIWRSPQPHGPTCPNYLPTPFDPAISYSRASWNKSMIQLALQLCVGHESPQKSPSFCVSSVRPAHGDS